jgi:hypothetical protein
MKSRIELLENAINELIQTANSYLKQQPNVTTNDIMHWEGARRRAEYALQPPFSFYADTDDSWNKINVAMYLEGLDKVSIQFGNFDIMAVDTSWLWQDQTGTPQWSELTVSQDKTHLIVPSIHQQQKNYTLHATLRDLDEIEDLYGHVMVDEVSHAGIGVCKDGTFEWLEKVGIDFADKSSIELKEIIRGFRKEPRREALLVIRHFVRLHQPTMSNKDAKPIMKKIYGDDIRWAVSFPMWAKK